MSTESTGFDRRLLTPAATAEYLGVSTATLAKWRCFGAQPLPYVRTGRLIRYRLSDIESYLRARTVEGPGTGSAGC